MTKGGRLKNGYENGYEEEATNSISEKYNL